MASLNALKRTGKRPYRRVGRGQSSTRGKQSGRGGKGQTARAGNKRRPEMRDIIKKLPKRRGYGKNRGRTFNPDRVQPLALSLTRIDKAFQNGAEITPATLLAQGLMGRGRWQVKIIGGTTEKKFTVKGCTVSASATSVIEKAGGSVAPLVVVEKAKKAKVGKPAKAGKKSE
ncbi:hypothetical protein A3C20_01220 [Candidatus Kaiserbacteria bacterium RIFCSPHIGHO2_02_FULL_55_25]|uniref:Large ribosomal subunit protein uL15 n=1 Tax=Candidatus Kaiserbacteria bacterium RIFCSPHIGHO2_02_FULL_55_25 TaxID=1798498 RepID=A0A1F6EAI1_9BACT|nr:MAG: hypothetical protein A2764_00320 [Candidatus Kaiserbacteria bacterium RIFCSPHIGHO2_01_FULL_55_79]OGG70617.1 MAG: hypothetical protein A3C20_01220 [Candidatus Kaiserbacteria bacterium RIFCSPHIGHO2_02_FULL_55_25]OGG78731.1 MAG: hypothetical protein A3F56_00780 [Candidatus Kaiserbacteria bacterium RIFCSPHIGHO2_12_FULL_55_13]OGG82694.1 MAG: hypothetical protein A3A42_02385 [Candidatus Kaiserbacteria bacterium RIFCSPLOWO2_01_FULL_55_25]